MGNKQKKSESWVSYGNVDYNILLEVEGQFASYLVAGFLPVFLEFVFSIRLSHVLYQLDIWRLYIFVFSIITLYSSTYKVEPKLSW